MTRVEEFPVAAWDLLTDVLLRGTFLVTRAVLPGMRARGFGRVVQIGSVHSLVASPYKSAYVAAKHALLGFAKAVARETAALEFLAGPMARNVTGQAITIDGGWTAR